VAQTLIKEEWHINTRRRRKRGKQKKEEGKLHKKGEN
jgi:hypothetical protein